MQPATHNGCRMFDINRYWYQRRLFLLNYLLLPFSWIFHLIITVRKALYRHAFLKVTHVSVPVVVVGNLTVGGTGKTPFVIWLANFLVSKGYHPGIISRGVGGKVSRKPQWVTKTASPHQVGDEAILLSTHTHCPLVVSSDRVKAVHALLRETHCDIILSDDGLQHYRLGRRMEIVLIDSQRHFGNQQLLPAGPLRESMRRLNEVDFVIGNGINDCYPYTMQLYPDQFISLVKSDALPLTALNVKTIHAVAGIGHPERFFTLLREQGFTVIPHVFPDHYLYQPVDLDFADMLPIVMTEKDAVKCYSFADKRYWYLRICVKMDKTFESDFLQKLTQGKSDAKENNVVPVAPDAAKPDH